MPCQLPADCLNEIFENLEDDKHTLHSCLLVNRLWCKVSVRILWRNIWGFKYYLPNSRRLRVETAILSTLIACLPNESKDFLHNNGIFILTPTLKPPLFNYASFCKVLSINEIGRIIEEVLKSATPIASLNLKDRNCLVAKEIIKMFLNQISSLKKLTYYLRTNYFGTLSLYNISIPENIPFSIVPGERDCLTDLSELHCSSNIHSEVFHHLSQICHNIQSLIIEFENYGIITDELKELISSQKNLKSLNLSAYGWNNWTDIIPTLTKHSNTLTKLRLHSDNETLPLSFVASLSNLQDITFGINSEDFKILQYVTFPKLQTLKILYEYPKPEYIIKFLENNGKNLKEFYTDESDNALNLSIAKFCPNLKKLFIIFNNDELDILKTIFNKCQYLESIKIWCGERCLSEREVLETVAKYSPKNFYELKLYNYSQSELSPEDLDSFFIGWKDLVPKKSLILVIIKGCYNSLEVNKENMKIIEKYKNLGVIKKFETKEFDDEEENYY